MTTGECCCFMPFKLEGRFVRAHTDMKRNVCPGSGLEPREPLKTVWWATAGRTA